MSWIDLTEDRQMKNLIQVAKNIAPSKATVLVSGESGVGKEVMSRYVHEASARAKMPYIAVNCAALPENLLESELFGFERGAFTGATHAKPGKLELAKGGTFVLDEISEMPFVLQAKLLRIIQEGQAERLGSTSSYKVDVRFICTTNRELSDMVKKGEFRKDLFYRLNVIPIRIPPLRFRQRDLKNLIRLFLRTSCEENNIYQKQLSENAYRKIISWEWPGNIRELKNVIDRSVLLAKGNEISEDEVLIEGIESHQNKNFGPGMTVHEAERLLIVKTLEHTEQNRTRAAELLGISVRTLRNKLNEYSQREAV